MEFRVSTVAATGIMEHMLYRKAPPLQQLVFSQCMQSLATICSMAKQEALTEDELLQWRRLSVEHTFHYACCNYRAYPKFHYLQHFPQHIPRGGVPRTYWVYYSDESKNKQVKGLWAAVSKKLGNGATGAPQTILAGCIGMRKFITKCVFVCRLALMDSERI